jgi:hypothetical protein
MRTSQSMFSFEPRRGLALAVGAIVAATLLAAAPSAAWAVVPPNGKVIANVPDWLQPSDPAPAPNIAGYWSWCAPTAGACLMGYWEDVLGKAGLTDGQVAPATVNPFPASPSWMQGLWQDGCIELGWKMNTDGWNNQNPTQYPPNAAGGTQVINIGPGALQYATGAWFDAINNVNKTGYAGITWKDMVLGQPMWNNYKAEIDAGRPVLCSYERWVSNQTGTASVDGQTVHLYNLEANPTETNGHTVCGVGYFDPTPGQPWSGDERIIAEDNWGSTPMYVAVLFGDINGQSWEQNDYINLPEPATLAILAVGASLVVRFKRRGRRERRGKT